MLKLFKEYNTKHLVILGIVFLLAVFTRFYQIEKIPTFIYQDEMGYIISAITLNYSGSDIVGTWNPWSLTPVSPNIAALDELTTQFIAPFFRLPISNVLAAKMPFLLLSLIVPFFISGIAYQFTKSKEISLYAWVISLFNPWIWQVGRMSVDPYVSFSFYIIAAYLILKMKKWKKLISLVPLFFGFYHYQGHKLVFIFWVILFSTYLLLPNLKKKNLNNFFPTLCIVISTIFLFLYYTLVQLPNQSSNQRLNTLFTPNSPKISQLVNEERRLSIESEILTKIVNKYTIWSREIIKRLADTYSLEYLFLHGQGGNAPFSVWNHGLLYGIEFLTILFGFAYLINKKRFSLLLTLSFGLLVTVIPSLISESEAYYYRSSLNIPLLIILSSFGFLYLREILPKYIFLLVPIVYVCSVLYFFYIYFFQFPILSSERQYFSDKIISEYLRRSKNQAKIFVISPELEFTVETYLFDSGYINKNNVFTIQKMFQNRNYSLSNINFTNTCIPEEIQYSSETIIARWDVRKCNAGEESIFSVDNSKKFTNNPLQIKNIKDSGTVFTIYNDQLCSGLEINPYLQVRSLDNFDFKNMSDTEFCQTWLSKLIEQ